jgi:hypothetical protein
MNSYIIALAGVSHNSAWVLVPPMAMALAEAGPGTAGG